MACMFVGHGASDDEARGEVIQLCGGCLALLTELGYSYSQFLELAPSSDEDIWWGVLCETREEALEFKATLEEWWSDGGPSASKRFSAEKDVEDARNRRMDWE